MGQACRPTCPHCPRAELSQQAATAVSLKDRPDFGWALAGRLAESHLNSTLLNRPAYRWLRAAVQLLMTGQSASRRLKDDTVVSQAQDIHESDMLRPVVNAALMARDATARSVSDALHPDAAVVEASLDVSRHEEGYLFRLKVSNEGGECLVINEPLVTLRLQFGYGGVRRFGVSGDDGSFDQIGPSFTARPGKWIGAEVGLFCISINMVRFSGHTDIECFRFGPLQKQAEVRAETSGVYGMDDGPGSQVIESRRVSVG
ncbi:MAG: hypothetical protein RLZZ214_1334 [Verrucomicrobiota bacterium]